ncbi:hypothetical protein IWX49DRAFT_555348 [Phyllosticta citricarpa]
MKFITSLLTLALASMALAVMLGGAGLLLEQRGSLLPPARHLVGLRKAELQGRLLLQPRRLPQGLRTSDSSDTDFEKTPTAARSARRLAFRAREKLCLDGDGEVAWTAGLLERTEST